MKYDSAETKRLMELNLDTGVIDVNTLQQFSKAPIVSWLNQNLREIREHTIAYLKEILDTCPISDSLPSHIRSYCSEIEYAKAVSDLNKESPLFRRPLPAIVGVATRYDNITCQELMFRDSRSVIPSKKADGFIRLMSSIPVNERSRICAVLLNGQTPTKRLQYVIKSRLAELAAEQGISLYSLAWVNSYAMRAQNVLRDFLCEDIAPYPGMDTQLEDSEDVLRNDYLMTLVYYVCIQYGVSADRLLLHDYSRHAVSAKGEPFTEEQKRYLSLFLRANTLAQDIAIHDVIMAVTAGKRKKSFS